MSKKGRWIRPGFDLWKKLDPKKVARALYLAGGNKAEAARELGIHRSNLYEFLKHHPQVNKMLKQWRDEEISRRSETPHDQLSATRVWSQLETMNDGVPRKVRG
ncbi:helix-turn-helix domain-containing protein [Chelativorans sp. AA-79]|uniref:helix-turn-helix domain-containing protein n=1 Tax=Chelativorans sp. AA-79 TaxID=3028735 RepID=UPI0023FA1F1F|nr:helix-turn-helix domain-containing protein [Chelativorans sp. AA-79]WEX10303.1 helix-turn-helix domain-containing protein [Chelativorans sp. AA-79]